MTTKKELRNRIKVLKNEQNKKDWERTSDAIFAQIEETESFKKASSILAYWSMSDEVMTHKTVEHWSKCKKVYLPLINGDDLELVRFEGTEKMKPEPVFGILEPTSDDKVDICNIDLVIVPGVAFDNCCNRMGRGKGYYDRLLSESVAVKIGVAFSFQIVDNVPVDPHDVPLDMVVTEAGIINR
ncbi:5-formyltetrahydrofolate cyclo-ligase [uncultured Acetobacteroides sp.]|uniref:5-formyltetrahydrofolate cyclo-ligase n=1 Tax=uncultured Acetobacteroides sp. TaxID=1760811 RepID=UPI0029F47882|nr:5-formyltetrahydrofolate cyclo-ligase [uncultured Acetobacteroides sp.]